MESATLARIVPFSGQNGSIGPLFGGRLNSDAAFQCDVNLVGPEYFQTVGIPLVRGREILDTDRRDRPRIAVINETLARRFWPEADPLGQFVYLKQSDTNPPLAMEVAGVVGDSTYADPASRNPVPFYYGLGNAFQSLSPIPNSPDHIPLSTPNPASRVSFLCIS